MDPLSDVLVLLKPQSYSAAGFDLGGEWAIQFPAHDGFKCYAIASGQGWVEVEGYAAELGTAGDCFLLPQGLPFRVASDLGLTPIKAEQFYAATPDGGLNVYQGGGGTSGVVANFMLTGSHADILMAMLPPIVHIKREADKTALRWSIEQMMEELRNPQPGAALVLQQLATMLLIKALRLHIADGLQERVGWLFALADKRMSLAINGMHREPAHQWTLQSLAECAGMSRTAFAVKFRQTVGATPIEYLTQWRMRLAGERLTNSNDSISVIAQSLGYESESAFSTAFKRVIGCSPRQFSREFDSGAGNQ